MPALKEWSAAVHALPDGRQTVLLRKGGIGEKRFVLQANEFLLFPTVAHSHAERFEQSVVTFSPQPKAIAAMRIVIRAAAKVIAAVDVKRPERLPDIEDLHIWTAASVREDRLDFRPRHLLTAVDRSGQSADRADPARPWSVVYRLHQLGECPDDATFRH